MPIKKGLTKDRHSLTDAQCRRLAEARDEQDITIAELRRIYSLTEPQFKKAITEGRALLGYYKSRNNIRMELA